MTKEEKSKSLLSGILYGEIVFWCAITGITISIIGLFIYTFGSRFFNNKILLNALLAGKDPAAIWKEAAGREIIYGRWHLHNLSFGDAISMLGIEICALSAIAGIFGVIIEMIVKKEKPRIFLFFACAIAVVLILSATGIISFH